MERPRLRTMVPSDLATVPPVHATGRLGRTLADPDAAWARAAQDRWGFCGLLVAEDEHVVAVALLSPAPTLPEAHPLARCARSHDTAYLLALACDPARNGAHLARLCAQGLARHLAGQVVAVEALGGPREDDCLAPPLDWLLAAGFRPASDHPAPASRRVRLDVNSPLRWPSLDRAWELLAGLVPHPSPAPEPTGRKAG